MTTLRLWSLTLATLALGACSLELKKDDDDHADDSWSTNPYPNDGGSSSDGIAITYPISDSSCAECQEVSVFVQYALKEDLGSGRVLTVEAFGNDQFQGAPLATTMIGDFRAELGEFREVVLQLGPGEYFVRAYLTTERDPRVPYPMGGMEPVDDEPMGVFGAVSAPQSFRVHGLYDSFEPTEPVVISLNRLYKRPGSEPETNALLRLELKLADGSEAPDQKRLRIQLRATADLDELPRYNFDIASAELRVSGREGQAEFVTPSLVEGKYTVFVFVDGDDNGYYDAGELAALALENGQAKAVDIVKDHVRTIALELSPTPLLP